MNSGRSQFRFAVPDRIAQSKVEGVAVVFAKGRV